MDKKANRAAFVAKLRSGDYNQTKEILRDDKGFCCLGVAEDVRGAEWVNRDYSKNFFIRTEYGSFYDELTSEGQEYYGFSSRDGFFKLGENETFSLVECNDGLGLTFDQIADIIEYEPEGLFEDEYSCKAL